jgi:hypothetical protein
MIWRNPVAWFGLATLLIPLAIHLLVRHRAEPRPFPSLRFVQPTRLASVRRKMISDWPLLAIRMAMLALAVAALADPLWQSAARRAEWSTRQARAIVIDTTASVTGGNADGGTGTLARREATGAIRAETFATKALAEGIQRASAWLRTAPPARRELVVISDFQLGALDAAMLRDLPAHVGIRFLRTSGAPATRTVDGQARTQRTTTGDFTLRNPRVTLNASETAVTWADATPPSPIEIDTIDAATTPSEAAIQARRKSNIPDITLRPFDLKLRGSTADRPFLLAAANAVLAQGVPIAAGAVGVQKSVTIIIAGSSADDAAPGPHDAGTLITRWQVDVARDIATDTALARAAGRVASNTSSGAPEPWIVLMRDADGKPAILAASDGTNGNTRMLVWSRVAAADETTALLIRATLRALAGPDSFGEAEVIAIPDATLAQWQRPASDPPASEWRDVDGNDRRWLWGAVLMLIVAEQILRRRARHVDAQPDGKVLEHAA